MFIGHYSVAFIAKALNLDLPLWLLLLATQISDVMCFIFVNLGIETMYIRPIGTKKTLMFFAGDLYWTHSAIVGIPLAALIILLLFKMCHRGQLNTRRVFWLVFTCASHFLLDVIVHEKHLPWITPKLLVLLGQDPNSLPRIGFDLWTKIPYESFHQPLEAIMTVVSILFLILKSWRYLQKSIGSLISIMLLLLLNAGIPLHLYLERTKGAPHPTVRELLVVMIVLNGIYALLGKWVDSNIVVTTSPKKKNK